MNSICGCAPGNDITIWYSILLHTRIVSSRKKKARPNTVSLGILNIMLPIIVPIHTCLFLRNRYRLMINANQKRKKKKDTVGNLILPFVPSLTENGEIYWWIFFIGLGSVGTDGARTRSFRLDRAVLWPIELQSRGNKMYSIHILMISFKPFLFRLKSSCFNRDASDILISTRIYTLVRAARITSNPFVSLLPNRLVIYFSLKKKVFFCLYCILFIRLYT